MVHVKEMRPGLKKLEYRSRPMIFVGYKPSTKGYRAYDPVSHRVIITRDAVFDESARWDWSSPDSLENSFGSDDTFKVEQWLCSHLATPVEGSATRSLRPQGN